ncbi:MAG: hypothetical protein DCF16_14615 [Alphaproteobacteria bacterium]|nr:MAG: hypothetical protein DCF16_14615 [Alphaproteobacteria bacterium]
MAAGYGRPRQKRQGGAALRNTGVPGHEGRMRFPTLLALAFLVAAPARAEPLHDAVDAYALYQNDITALITLDVAANDLDAALALALRHDPDRVAQGWLAYGALRRL